MQAVICKIICVFLFFFFVACEEEQPKELLYNFPALSPGQLLDLKKLSEKVEGFFLTTNLSDLDPSWAERGSYIYVCIRFLNDPAVNTKLKKSAIPLLIQVSSHKDRPSAESVLLLHPRTIKPGGKGLFYYEETQKFKLASSPLVIKDEQYNIFDVEFNQKGKITHISFVKKGISVEQLQELQATDSEQDDTENEDSADESPSPVARDGEESAEVANSTDKQNWLLEVSAFARQFSSSCENWAILNYKHSTELPGYLQVQYSGPAPADPAEGGTEQSAPAPGQSSQPSVVTAQPLIDENAPHTPVEQD